MKRLVLLGEGQGDQAALPVLVRRLLREKDTAGRFYVDQEVIRESNPVKWNKAEGRPDFGKWLSRIAIAARRRELGGVLAVYDGDAPAFPAGSGTPFCAGNAARMMARAATDIGAGRTFSLAVVFACVEYETWLIAGVESLAGKCLNDGRSALPAGLTCPAGHCESHGKRWLLQHFPAYRPSLDQSALTEILDLSVVRSKALRSFRRLDNAVDQLLTAEASGTFIATPVSALSPRSSP